MADRLPCAGQTGRYVILRHQVGGSNTERAGQEPQVTGRGDHYDWMFEAGGVLLTWASEQWLPATQAAVVTAIQLPPHRLAYLDFEGEVAGDRGTVHRVESGTHQFMYAAADRYALELHGGRTGGMTLYRTAPSDSWSIAFAPGRGRPVRAEASW